MARPRVFISSTFYDLKSVRAELEASLAQLAYDAVLHERGRVPYEHGKDLENSCYREINNCDIVVAIVGGRFGSQSLADDRLSISQLELKTAIDLDKQLFVFVDRPVLTEYGTWTKNRSGSVTWAYVDNPKVFEFLKYIHDLAPSRPVQSFDAGSDIVTFLKEQFAGLFQRLLEEHQVREELNLAGQLRATADILNKTIEKATSDEKTVPELVFANQPMFQELRSLLAVPYRVFFVNLSELNALLNSRRFKPVATTAWDDPQVMEWLRTRSDETYDLLKISKAVLDDQDNVRYIPSSEWAGDMIELIDNYRDDDDGTGGA